MNSIKRLFWALLLPMSLSNAASADPEWGTAPYQAPSFYTVEGVAAEEFQDTVVLVFHGFRSAVPNKTFKRIRSLFEGDYSVVGINYDYFDATQTAAYLTELNETHLKNKRVLVFGTSLGGFWANWFGDTFGAEAVVLINPVVTPTSQMMQFVGEGYTSERRGISFDVSVEDVKNYAAVEGTKAAQTPKLVVLVLDDQTLDPNVARKKFGAETKTRVSEFEIGGHSINFVEHAARKAVVSFLRAHGFRSLD